MDLPKVNKFSFNPLNSAKNAINSTNAKINAKINATKKEITNKINSTKDAMNNAKKDVTTGVVSFKDNITKSLDSANKDLKNASGSAFSSAKDTFKTNYQKWLKYGVFFFLVAYVGIIVVGLFGLPPKILHNTFSFLTGILDYFRLDYTSIGKPPQSDNLVEEGKGIQVNYKKK